MSPYRKPMPSFTLVLTSGHHSLLSTTVQPDSYTSPTMLPTAPDHLMVRIYGQAYICFLIEFASFHVRKPLIYATIRITHLPLMTIPTRRPFSEEKGLLLWAVKQSKSVTTPLKYVHPQISKVGFVFKFLSAESFALHSQICFLEVAFQQ